MFYVYILVSKKDRKLYVGYTEDLQRRMKEHNKGRSFATKPRRPFILVYYESYLTRTDAMKRENMLKKQGAAPGGLKRRITTSLAEAELV